MNLGKLNINETIGTLEKDRTTLSEEDLKKKYCGSWPILKVFLQLVMIFTDGETDKKIQEFIDKIDSICK